MFIEKNYFSDDRCGPWACCFRKLIKYWYNLLDILFFLFQIPSSTPFLLLVNYITPSHPTKPGILYRLQHLSSLHTSTLSLTQQHKLRTTSLNNVNSKPPHLTMWTPHHPTEQCELQIIPLNNMNSIPPNWTMWTPANPTEQYELQTTPLNNVNFRPPQ